MLRRLTHLLLAFAVTLLMAASTPSLAADFSGTWKLDLKASDSIDPILKAQGVSWIKRKAAANLNVTQTIAQRGNEVAIETETSAKNRSEKLLVDGKTRTEERERGPVELRHEWKGEAILSTAKLSTEDGLGELITHRSLSDDGKTMTLRLTLKGPDGSTKVINRVFRKS